MNQIAVCVGDTFIYWSSVIIFLGIAACFALTYALYTSHGGRGSALWLLLPLALFFSVVLARLIHWYCHDEQYAGFMSAMLDYSQGVLQGLHGRRPRPVRSCSGTLCRLLHVGHIRRSGQGRRRSVHRHGRRRHKHRVHGRPGHGCQRTPHQRRPQGRRVIQTPGRPGTSGGSGPLFFFNRMPMQ